MEMLSKLVVPFDLGEIDYRVYEGRVEKNGDAFVAVYPVVTPQAVQRRLDTVVGAHRWQSKITSTAHGILCEISIEVESGKWITKSELAPDASGDSRAFVRAAAAWGIGRELFDSPLEFADVVEAGVSGSRSFDTEKQTIYWLPPSAEKPATPVHSSIPKKAATVLNGKKAQATVNSKATTRPSAHSPGFAVVPFGYTKGKMLKDLNEQELNGLASFYDKVDEPQGKARYFREPFMAFLNSSKQAG